MNLEGLGITLLNKLKQATSQQPDFDRLFGLDTQPPSHEAWDRLLQQHVTEAGWVNYEGFLADKDSFEAYLASLSASPANTETWSEAAQLAYWINVYNAFTVKVVLDYYPVDSIRDIAGAFPFINSVFDLKFFEIGGQPMDLNTVEHQILRKHYQEPRIHFAINCASFSCPKLLNRAFTVDLLETQLEDQAHAFVNDPTKNELTPDKANLSKIFAWYEQDFTAVKPLIAYINDYSDVRLADNASVSHLVYDWSLNKIPSEEG